MENLKKNKVLVGIFVLTAVAFGYYFIGPSSAPALPGGNPGGDIAGIQNIEASDQSGKSGDIATLFQQLGSASIDTDLFASPAWLTLKDISTPLPNDPAGKSNPFAPIGQGGAQSVVKVATTTTTTTSPGPKNTSR